MGFFDATGVGSSCMSCRSGSHHGSKNAATRGVGICGGTARSASGYGTAAGAVNMPDAALLGQ